MIRQTIALHSKSPGDVPGLIATNQRAKCRVTEAVENLRFGTCDFSHINCLSNWINYYIIMSIETIPIISGNIPSVATPPDSVVIIFIAVFDNAVAAQIYNIFRLNSRLCSIVKNRCIDLYLPPKTI